MAPPSPPPSPRHVVGPRRRFLAAACALLLVVGFAGCAALTSMSELQGELEDDGFRDVRTSFSPDDLGVLVISADGRRGTPAVDEAQEAAAEVVWTRFSLRFDALRVTIDGEPRSWTYAELSDELGDRPGDLGQASQLEDEWNRLAVGTLIGMLAGGVLLVGAIAFITILVVRANRRAHERRPSLQPWMPVPTAAGPPVTPPTPTAPPGGWAPASAPPGPPAPPGLAASPDAADTGGPDAPDTIGPDASGPSGAPAGPSLEKAPVPASPGAAPWPPPPTAPVPTRRPRDPDARRLGRRPPGRTPDATHTPPGWG